MAIVKYNFRGANISAQATEILEWLQTNATDFFSTIEADANGNVSCYIGDKLCAKFNCDGSNPRCQLFNRGDRSAQAKSYVYSSSKIFTYAIKTSKGFMISWQNYSSNAVQDSVWFCRTDKGNTGIVALFQQSSTASTGGAFLAASFEANEWYREYFSGQMSGSNWDKFFHIRNDFYTTLSPVYCAYTENSTPDYCKDIFIVRFAQYNVGWSAQKLVLNGHEYMTNGYLAIGD